MNVKLLLLAAFVVAIIFRFTSLTSYPVSYSMDEVSIGYNAYSMVTTGRDEWGESFPLTFRSLSDYKPPVSIYLTAISIIIFGFGEFAVRFPNALIGSLTIFPFWAFLTRLGFTRKTAVVGALWLAINPWHVYFSRGGFETLIALFFVIMGIWLFLKGVSEKSYISLYLSLASFSLSVWTYHAERVFVPALVLALALIKRRELVVMFSKKTLKAVFAIAIIALFSVPLLYVMLFTPASTRAMHTSLLRDFHLTLHNGEYISFTQLIFDNDLFLIARAFLGKYFNYLDIEYLFKHGLALVPKSFTGMGLLYLANLPVVALGLYSLVFHQKKELRVIAMVLFILGPLPAALTLDEQHSLRALTWLPFWGVAFVAGVEKFTSLKLKLKRVLVGAYALCLLFNISYFADMYFRQFPYFYAELWLYGYKQAALLGCSELNNYDQILITDTFGTDGPLYTGVPYIYVLFYCKIPPKDFLANNRQIEGFAMRRPDWRNDSTENMLIIAAPYDLPLDEIPESRVNYIKYPNGKVAFVVVIPD